MSPPLLSPVDLAAFMQQHGIQGTILHLDSPTPTVETAAQAAGTIPDRIVKSILFLVNEQPLLAVTCGLALINYRALAAHLGVNRKKVRMASPDVVLEIAGYEVGAMPPFGHRSPLRTLVDWRVLEQTEVYAGGGAENALVRTSPTELVRVANAEVLDLQVAPTAAPDEASS